MKIRKILCLFLAVLLTAGAAAVPAHALEAGSPGSLTESFIDEATGREIAPAQVSKSPWVKEAPEIAGYEFTGFTQETRHIYSQEDLTYILGYPDKTVQGEGNLRRSEAVAIFYRLHAGAFPPLQRQMNRKTFLDVAGGAWFYKELEMCYNIGMVEGIGEHRFNPNAPVTRAEFAALAARFASLPHSGEALFNDISPEHWAFQAINAAAKAGWVKGYPDGSFKPDSFITRAEAVSLINRMRNRSITAEELNRLGVENPYTDLVETYWAYGDLLEATVKHSAADWHKLNFSGTVNQVTERFVDENGSEIAEAVATGGAENHAYKDVKNFRYMGYAATITYVYQRGAARLAAEKGVDKTSAQVGDKLVYSVVVQNETEATDSLKNVVLADELPAFVDFLHGSVQADGVTARHTYDHGRRKLSVGLGEIKPGQQKVITFGVTVNAAAYGQKFRNTAVISADNHTDVKASDPGVTIGPGETRPAAEKSVDKSHAKVGDTLTYTITASNGEGASVPLENVVLADDLPVFVDFSHGSVQLDGETARYSFDSRTRQLTVQLGDIAPKSSKTVTFEAGINDSAYGQAFKNTAVLSADNSPAVPAADSGTTVEAGTARLAAAKSVDKSRAKVGDTLTYTITASNAETATANLENVVVQDAIPGHLTFDQGSVQVDGFAARNFYDNETRQLTVELGGIAPGQTKTAVFTCKVNSSAYGAEITNTAVLSADNSGEIPAADQGVSIEPGMAEGSAGAKTVDRPTAKAGETLTYTITLRNAASATAHWENVRVTDILPEHLSFADGSVEENGRASTHYTYDAAARTLTLLPEPIEPGADVVFTFRAVVEDGAQGLYIVNTAVVQSPGREDMQLPDTGVQIDAGSAAPQMGKSASVAEARPGDIFRYTIQVKNGEEATADWKNVVVSDILPTGVRLVSGSVTLNRETVSYGVSGQAVEVTVGDLKPGQDAAVSFEARVLDSAAGSTLENMAGARGDNGQKSAADDGVAVPLPDDEEAADTVTGTKNVDRTVLNTGEQAAYTITARNNSRESWEGVQVYDLLDTSMLTLIDDSVLVDGVRFLPGSGKWTFAGRQLVFNLGDIPAGKAVVCEFKVQFKNDAANSTYINHATLKSTSHDEVYLKAPEVAVMASEDHPDAYTNIHYKLFIGEGAQDGTPLHLWGPDNKISLCDICIVGNRLMTDYYRKSVGNGTITVPSAITDRDVRFFMSHGVLRPDEYISWEVPATQDQIYRVLSFALKKDLGSSSQAPMARHEVAALICKETQRDISPRTNGLNLAHFTDKGPYGSLIDEVSNSHDYTLDSNGRESWVSILD